MRLLLPLVSGLAAGLALSPASYAEDAPFVITSITVEAKADPALPGPALTVPENAPERAVMHGAAAPEVSSPANTDVKKAVLLRGSLFMMILPNLCCRY